MKPHSGRLADTSPELERLLTRGNLPPARFAPSEIECKTVWVTMRDGVRLATDLYLPPAPRAPVVAVRTPYDRSRDDRGFMAALLAFARRGYVAISQDCRGTGASEPDGWDYYVFEADDSFDLVEWIACQDWFDGFIGSCGGSYAGQTQWCMAMHRAMSTIVPTMSGLGAAFNTAHLYMFLDAYARTIGKGEGKVAVRADEMERLHERETMAGGYFNEPLHFLPEAVRARFPELQQMSPTTSKTWLWEKYCAMSCAERAEFFKNTFGARNVTSVHVESSSAIFGHRISHDALTLPHTSQPDLCRKICAPPLLLTGWYDWALNDALATWHLLRRECHPQVAGRARLLITPHAHNVAGYHEGVENHPELLRAPSMLEHAGLLLCWYAAVREGRTDSWPAVIYYLMGANEWRVAADWPPLEATQKAYYLGPAGSLTTQPPEKTFPPDCYTYDPLDPTPTVGGSVVSFVYPAGSVDVSKVQRRADVLVYSTPPLEEALDVVGPLRMVLHASSTAVDTDFVVRITDVFPDGRAIQLQSGILRARYRNLDGEPQFLEPDKVYRLEIDMWATANRFKVGHRLRVDISSADFPHFDRNSNRGGQPGNPIPARQTVHHGPEQPSRILLSVLAA